MEYTYRNIELDSRFFVIIRFDTLVVYFYGNVISIVPWESPDNFPFVIFFFSSSNFIITLLLFLQNLPNDVPIHNRLFASHYQMTFLHFPKISEERLSSSCSVSLAKAYPPEHNSFFSSKSSF